MQHSQSNPTFVQALGHVQSDRRLDILRQIGELGSISKAARAVGVSYKAAWQAVDTLTNLSGVALLDKAVGGRGGGGAQLTEAGRQLLSAAQALKSARADAVQSMHGHAEQHTTAAARLGVRTSMRNQWPCVVADLQIEGQLARVLLHGVADSHFRVCARVTLESVELLGLHKGIQVQALCKATAVNASAAIPSQTADEVNIWSAQVTRSSRGSLGDEVSATLAGGLQIVGFTRAGETLRVRSRARMSVDESAIVLAIDSH